jgi:hypothetical protein
MDLPQEQQQNQNNNWIWARILQIPPFTRIYISLCFLTSFLLTSEYITYYDIYYSYDLVFHEHQYWRLITAFLCLGPFSFSLIITLFYVFVLFMILINFFLLVNNTVLVLKMNILEIKL